MEEQKATDTTWNMGDPNLIFFFLYHDSRVVLGHIQISTVEEFEQPAFKRHSMGRRLG